MTQAYPENPSSLYPHPRFNGGLSGLQLPVPKYDFPEPFQHKSRLEFYSSHFNSIEINSSFYKVPQQKTAARWAASVPPAFRFTFKLLRDVTHIKELNFKQEDIYSFMKAINGVGSKKACILVQLPPSLTTAYLPQMDTLLRTLQTCNEGWQWDVAVEFRNRAWYNEEVYDLLEENRCALVMHDKPSCAPPWKEPFGDFTYLRFHGPAGDYRGSYSGDQLRDQAERVEDLVASGKRVHVYFNNTAGDAFRNLIDFYRMVRAR